MKIFYKDDKKPLLKQLSSDVNRKTLDEDFYVVDSRGVQFFVPKGYVTDGASIPDALEIFIGDPFASVTETAALIHDFECEYAAFCLDTSHEDDLIQCYPNLPLLKIEKAKGREYKSQKVVHRAFRELTYFEMKRNKEYGWAPWKLHKNKLWQYQRCKLMWLAVRTYNWFTHREWK
jgi:hypothetical protein